MHEIFWLLQGHLIANQMRRVREFEQNLRSLPGVSEVHVTVWVRTVKVQFFASDPNAAHIQQLLNEFRENNSDLLLKVQSN